MGVGEGERNLKDCNDDYKCDEDEDQNITFGVLLCLPLKRELK